MGVFDSFKNEAKRSTRKLGRETARLANGDFGENLLAAAPASGGAAGAYLALQSGAMYAEWAGTLDETKSEKKARIAAERQQGISMAQSQRRAESIMKDRARRRGLTAAKRNIDIVRSVMV